MRVSSIDHPVGLEPAEAPALLKPIWQRLLDRVIDLYLVVWLFIATGAILSVLMVGKSGDFAIEDQGLLSLLKRGPVILIAPFLIVSRFKAVTALLLRNPVLLLLLLWIWCSVLWSVAPEISMRRALMLTLFTLLACYLVVRHDLDWILKRLAWLYLALLLAAVLFILFLPSLIPQRNGLGVIFIGKNQMGGFLLEAVILLPPAISKRLIRPALGLAGLLIALALLVPVNSVTAMVAGILVLATYAAILLWRLPARLAATLTAFGVAIACISIVAMVVNYHAIFELLGRDTDLHGRTPIWQYFWEMIQHRPLIGYGYQAFFEAEENAAYVAAVWPWAPPSAHNGYLELLLAIGAVGLTLFMVFIGSGLVRAAVASNRPDPIILLVLLPLLVGYTVRAIAVSNLLDYSSIAWVLVVIFTVSLTPNLAAIRMR